MHIIYAYNILNQIMSYYFVENKYPISDPNLDLNFANDILYNDLYGKYSNDQKHTPKINPPHAPKKNKKYNYIYLFFIILIILLIFFWCIYNNYKKNISYDGYTSDADLILLSPDMGLGTTMIAKK